MADVWEEAFREFIHDIERPLFVYKMARAAPHVPGAAKRMANAQREIKDIAAEYVHSTLDFERA